MYTSLGNFIPPLRSPIPAVPQARDSLDSLPRNWKLFRTPAAVRGSITARSPYKQADNSLGICGLYPDLSLCQSS